MEIVSNVDGSKATFVLSGKVVVQTAPDLEAAIGAVPVDVCDFDIDLERVDYISSAGLRVLVAAQKLAKQRGGDMRLLNPVDSVMEVFEMTGLSEVLTIER